MVHRSQGNTANFELKSETANNNGAALAPNTRYYIQIGQNDETDISGSQDHSTFYNRS